MPTTGEVGEATHVRVIASALLELMWSLHNLQAKHVLNGPYASLGRLRADMQPKVASFWADGVRGYTETIVLAERSGTTLDLDLDRYFEKLDEAIEMVDGGLSLLSERPSERVAFQTRVKRLREDRDLRGKYRSLLLSAWEPLRAEWEASGRRAACDAAIEWGRMLEGGAGYPTPLDPAHALPGPSEPGELAGSPPAGRRQVLAPAATLRRNPR